MKVRLKTAKGDGTSIGTVLRQITLNSSKSWRPIAYKLSCQSNLLQASDLIVEDMIEFTSSLASLSIEVSSAAPSMLQKTYIIKKGQFMSSDLSDPDITVSPNIPLLTSLSETPITLDIIYMESSGNRSSDMNIESLKDNGDYSKQFNVISSRHSAINNFTFEVNERGIDEEELVMLIESPFNGEDQILKESLKTLAKYLSEVAKSLESR